MVSDVQFKHLAYFIFVLHEYIQETYFVILCLVNVET